MKTFAQLVNYCEKLGLQYEVNKRYLDDDRYLPAEERCEFGCYFGICNLANRKGASEWSWTWFMCFDKKSELTDESVFYFEERYSQMVGRSYKGWREAAKAEEAINRLLNA